MALEYLEDGNPHTELGWAIDHQWKPLPKQTKKRK
jgi:hypothetical protein